MVYVPIDHRLLQIDNSENLIARPPVHFSLSPHHNARTHWCILVSQALRADRGYVVSWCRRWEKSKKNGQPRQQALQAFTLTSFVSPGALPGLTRACPGSIFIVNFPAISLLRLSVGGGTLHGTVISSVAYADGTVSFLIATYLTYLHRVSS